MMKSGFGGDRGAVVRKGLGGDSGAATRKGFGSVRILIRQYIRVHVAWNVPLPLRYDFCRHD